MFKEILEIRISIILGSVTGLQKAYHTYQCKVDRVRRICTRLAIYYVFAINSDFTVKKT